MTADFLVDYLPLGLLALLFAAAAGAYLLEASRDLDRKRERDEERERARLAQIADEAAALTAYQAEMIRCRAHRCIDPWQPRRDFWELQGEGANRGLDHAYVCSACYVKLTGQAPEGNPYTRRAFLVLPSGHAVAPTVRHRSSVLLRPSVDWKGNPTDPYAEWLATIPELPLGRFKG